MLITEIVRILHEAMNHTEAYKARVMARRWHIADEAAEQLPV